jgi:hypothetical protein
MAGFLGREMKGRLGEHGTAKPRPGDGILEAHRNFVQRTQLTGSIEATLQVQVVLLGVKELDVKEQLQFVSF